MYASLNLMVVPRFSFVKASKSGRCVRDMLGQAERRIFFRCSLVFLSQRFCITASCRSMMVLRSFQSLRIFCERSRAFLRTSSAVGNDEGFGSVILSKKL